ncbi:MAG: leucine-rich repeat protein [Clostridia bacterium]|nr:leucine-rich repeat protein [Clostridia bacterium]
MIELFQKILSVIMSLFVWLGVPVEHTDSVTTAEDEFVDVDPNWNISSSETEFFLNNPSFWLTYEIKDQKAYITGAKEIWIGYDGFIYRSPTPLIFPETIEGCPVVSIGGLNGDPWPHSLCFGNDFSDSYDTITIPDTVETIEDNAFSAIDASVVYIGKNVKTIGHRAFEYYKDVSGVRDGTIIVGKSVETVYRNSFMMYDCTICCYKDSAVYECFKDLNEQSYRIIIINESHLTSNTATIDDELNVRGLPSGLTKETVKDYVSVDGDAIMEISDDVITTGTTIELINREYGTIDNTYTVIIDGDINGDGSKASSEDFTAMRDIITGSDSEYSDINKQAADLNGDGIVNSTDLTIMKSLLN